jgi:hypothetical protein
VYVRVWLLLLSACCLSAMTRFPTGVVQWPGASAKQRDASGVYATIHTKTASSLLMPLRTPQKAAGRSQCNPRPMHGLVRCALTVVQVLAQVHLRHHIVFANVYQSSLNGFR